MLAWYFFHASYSGNSVISEDLLNRYTREISKPGFLRPHFEFFATTKQEAEFFNRTIAKTPLANPILILGGEVSLGPIAKVWGKTGTNVSYAPVPKAGHWLGKYHID